MAILLSKLGIRSEVQDYFRDTYIVGHNQDLIFNYGAETERFGPGFHRVPKSESFWCAGQANIHLVRSVIISASAMDALCWLHLYYNYFNLPDQLCFLATGILPDIFQIQKLRAKYPLKKIILVMGNDTFGRIDDIRIATALFQKRCKVNLIGQEGVKLWYKKRDYHFAEDKLTLNAFEKVSGLRSGIKTYKPPRHTTFLEQMLENNVLI